MLPGELRSKGNLPAETKVGKIFKEINSKAQKARQYSAGGCRNPNVYKADYFRQKIHYDESKKLGMYGLVYVCARIAIHGGPLACYNGNTPFCYVIHRKTHYHQGRTRTGKKNGIKHSPSVRDLIIKKRLKPLFSYELIQIFSKLLLVLTTSSLPLYLP